MKCVCGYEHFYGKESKSPIWDTEQRIADGVVEFKRIDGRFEVMKDRFFELDEVSLYACPKCGTIRMEL